MVVRSYIARFLFVVYTYISKLHVSGIYINGIGLILYLKRIFYRTHYLPLAYIKTQPGLHNGKIYIL